MPRHISLIFPGQGSQSIGMLNSFSEDELNNITKISKEVLDTDIVDCIKNGPEEDLNRTSITQPALVIASYCARISGFCLSHCLNFFSKGSFRM